MLINRYEKFEHSFDLTSNYDLEKIKNYLKELVDSKNFKDTTLVFNKGNEIEKYYFEQLYKVPTVKLNCPTYFFGSIRFHITSYDDKIVLKSMYSNIINEKIKISFY